MGDAAAAAAASRGLDPAFFRGTPLLLPDSAGSSSSISQSRSVPVGVAMDGLTAGLLGIDFLPFSLLPAGGGGAAGDGAGTGGGGDHDDDDDDHDDGASTLDGSASTAGGGGSGVGVGVASSARKGGGRGRRKGKGAAAATAATTKKKKKRRGGRARRAYRSLRRSLAGTTSRSGSAASSSSSSSSSAAAAASTGTGTGTAAPSSSSSSPFSPFSTSAPSSRAVTLAGRIRTLASEISDLEGRLGEARGTLRAREAELAALRGLEGRMEAAAREAARAPLDGVAEAAGGAGDGSVPSPSPSPSSPPPPPPPPPPSGASPPPSLFLRVHELDLPPVSVPATSPPRPGLTDLSGPAAPAAVEALASLALEAMVGGDPARWIPTPDTRRLLARGSGASSSAASAGGTGTGPGPVHVWHSRFDHGGYGCDLPVVRARGTVPAPAADLALLLLDSSRAGEYNKMSVGRVDEYYFHRNLALRGGTPPSVPGGGGGEEEEVEVEVEVEKKTKKADDPPRTWEALRGETRLLRALSKPPMVRRPMELLTVYHARELDGGGWAAGGGGHGGTGQGGCEAGRGEEVPLGYLIASRSVWETADHVPTQDGRELAPPGDTSRTEVLLGAQLIRPLPGGRCELTTVNHMCSKAVPLMLARKVGLVAAASFVRDIQNAVQS